MHFFINIIDCVVSAVVEQVYSSNFQFCLLKRQKSVPETLHFLPLNAPKCVWWPGSTWTRWGSLERSPRPPSWIKGREGGEWERGRGGRGKGEKREGKKEKGRTPQCLNVLT